MWRRLASQGCRHGAAHGTARHSGALFVDPPRVAFTPAWTRPCTSIQCTELDLYVVGVEDV
jgi:hypothetical protein